MHREKEAMKEQVNRGDKESCRGHHAPGQDVGTHTPDIQVERQALEDLRPAGSL